MGIDLSQLEDKIAGMCQKGLAAQVALDSYLAAINEAGVAATEKIKEYLDSVDADVRRVQLPSDLTDLLVEIWKAGFALRDGPMEIRLNAYPAYPLHYCVELLLRSLPWWIDEFNTSHLIPGMYIEGAYENEKIRISCERLSPRQ